MPRKSNAEKKLAQLLARKSRCLSCGYYKNGYCNDLDVRVDPNYPVCSEQNYRA